MAWVRIDDRFHRHPKVVGLSHAAIGLYLLGLCYANEYLTDGWLPINYVSAKAKREAQALVLAGLWEERLDGYRIHDYLEYQPSRKQVERVRAERRRAGQAGAKARWNGHGPE